MRHLSYVAMLAFTLAGSLPLEALLGTRVLGRWRRLLLTMVPVLVVFVAWDLYAISRGHWDFDPAQTLGVRVPGGIPVEEVAFFVVVPLASVLTLEAVRSRRPAWQVGDE